MYRAHDSRNLLEQPLSVFLYLSSTAAAKKVESWLKCSETRRLQNKILIWFYHSAEIMSSGGFSFPPPPPPPPPSIAASFTGSGYGQHRGGGAGNQHRGRGRGGPHRGSAGRGGHTRDSGNHRGGYGASRGYQRHVPATPNPMQYNNNNNNNASHHQVQQNAMYNHPLPTYPTQAFGTQSGPMTHPLHAQQQPFGWGSSSPFPGGPSQHQAQGGFRPHGQNRGSISRSNAGGKRPHSVSRPSAPLPVPSFGNPLPSKPPPPAPDTTQKHQTKKRKYNQLGLTPKTEEHESSQEEDDADEEIKLAAKVPAGELSISYGGKTSTLRSQADIERWIEERRKRFPTQARVEERIKEAEAKKAEKEAMKRQKAAAAEESRQRAKEARPKKEKGKQDRGKQDLKENETPTDPAVKAKQRAEKLRNKLMKQELKVAKAEADADKAKLLAEESESQSATAVTHDDVAGTAEETVVSANSALQPEGSKKRSDAQETLRKERGLETTSNSRRQSPQGPAVESTEAQITESPILDGQVSSDLESAKGSVETGSGDEETSSSGSDLSSDMSSDDRDSGAAPEEMSSRRQRPDRVPPPPREGARPGKAVCHQFAKSGRCQRGDQCKFVHEQRERAEQSNNNNKNKNNNNNRKQTDDQPKGRQSLFQTVGLLLFVLCSVAFLLIRGSTYSSLGDNEKKRTAASCRRFRGLETGVYWTSPSLTAVLGRNQQWNCLLSVLLWL